MNSHANSGVCFENKQSKAPVTEKFVEGTEIVTLRISKFVPLPVHSLSRNCNFITMKRTVHYYTHVQMLKTRYKAPRSYFDHMSWIHRNCKVSIHRVHSDNAKELLGMKNILSPMVIKLTMTFAPTQKPNGVAERMYRKPLKNERVLLKEARTPLHLWHEAMNHANHLYNRKSSPS